MRFIIVGLMLYVAITTNAQVKYDYNWGFGYSSNTTDSTFGGTDINFNHDPVNISYIYRELDLRTTNTTMSDAEGNLIFYSNGCKVFNANHELMENGDDINPGQIHDIQCQDAYTVHQGILPLPKPGSDSVYYLFHEHIDFTNSGIITDQLLYTIIDMRENEGLGKVAEKNLIGIEDTLGYGELSAIKHSNGHDWWVLVPKDTSAKYLRMLLTEDTLLGPYEQSIGVATQHADRGDGQTNFSPDGTKYARTNETYQLMLYDFDRSTGLLSNPQQFSVDDSIGGTSASFSPNSRFLYVDNTIEIYQYDLWEDDIQSSQTLVGTWDGFLDLGIFSTRFRHSQLGPDCRLYINTVGSTRYLHLIHHPDEKGMACGFEQRAIKLPTWNARALPLLPNYRLGVEPTYPCDSTIALPVPVRRVVRPQVGVEVYPNPVSVGGVVQVVMDKGVDGSLLLYDVLGRGSVAGGVEGAYTAACHRTTGGTWGRGVFLFA